MKLGTETGSLVNHIYSNMTFDEVYIGMPATLLSWSDRYPATVKAIHSINGKTVIEVIEDHYTRIDSNGMSESQEYEYSPNPNGRNFFFRKNKNEKMEAIRKNPDTGRWVKSGSGYGVLFGKRERYYDFSF